MERTADIVLVSCAKKQDKRPGLARNHYTSSRFQKARQYAEARGALWFILSPKYGLLEPTRTIEWYDVDISDYSPDERRQLSREFVDTLAQRMRNLRGKVIEIHAGKQYIDNGLEEGLVEAGAIVRKPLTGLRDGEQLQWYNAALR